jgi:hypothetical protein
VNDIYTHDRDTAVRDALVILLTVATLTLAVCAPAVAIAVWRVAL